MAFEGRFKRKITSQQIYEIRLRRSEGESPKALALEYGISAGYVRSLQSSTTVILPELYSERFDRS